MSGSPLRATYAEVHSRTRSVLSFGKAALARPPYGSSWGVLPLPVSVHGPSLRSIRCDRLQYYPGRTFSEAWEGSASATKYRLLATVRMTAPSDMTGFQVACRRITPRSAYSARRPKVWFQVCRNGYMSWEGRLKGPAHLLKEALGQILPEKTTV